jgi:cation transporter-like permease
MFDFAQHLVTSTDLSVLNPSAIDLASNLHGNLADLTSHLHMDLIAQQFKQDVMGDLGKGWDNFVKTGQIWALIIGVVVGYLFRSITAA